MNANLKYYYMYLNHLLLYTNNVIFIQRTIASDDTHVQYTGHKHFAQKHWLKRLSVIFVNCIHIIHFLVVKTDWLICMFVILFYFSFY